jgi:SH3 domain protein
MKPPVLWCAIFGIALGAFSNLAYAEPMYVNDVMEVTLRTGQGISHKILAMVKSGQDVETIEPGAEWTKVRLPNQKEGWVLTRFLTTQPPARLELERLKAAYRDLQSKTEAPMKEITKLREENNARRTDLAAKEKALKELKNAYETLKKESADFLKLNSKYKKSAQLLEEQTQRANQFEEELSKIQLHRNIRWFLSGAGVLLLGLLIGFSTKRQRRRSSLL